MATRRQAACARRRGAHHLMRAGTVPQQEGTGGDGPGGKAQKAVKAQKARRG